MYAWYRWYPKAASHVPLGSSPSPAPRLGFTPIVVFAAGARTHSINHHSFLHRSIAPLSPRPSCPPLPPTLPPNPLGEGKKGQVTEAPAAQQHPAFSRVRSYTFCFLPPFRLSEPQSLSFPALARQPSLPGGELLLLRAYFLRPMDTGRLAFCKYSLKTSVGPKISLYTVLGGVWWMIGKEG